MTNEINEISKKEREIYTIHTHAHIPPPEARLTFKLIHNWLKLSHFNISIDEFAYNWPLQSLTDACNAELDQAREKRNKF